MQELEEGGIQHHGSADAAKIDIPTKEDLFESKEEILAKENYILRKRISELEIERDNTCHCKAEDYSKNQKWITLINTRFFTNSSYRCFLRILCLCIYFLF